MKKHVLKKATACILAVGLLTVFAACSAKGREEITGDKNYLKTVNAYSFWANDSQNSIAQYHVYDHVKDFLSDGKIENGDAVSPDGKVKKVLFLGFDGMRADAAANILHDENEFETNGYHAGAQFSALQELKEAGGIYLAYCGGEYGTDTQQTTSTSASWTSQFTGAWGTQHGIQTNDDSKNMEYKTFMLQYAEKGLKTSIAFDWDQYFDVNLKEEVRYVMEHPDIDMTFCDIDREKSGKLRKTRAETIEMYNFVAPETPSESAPYDDGMRNYILSRIDGGDDIVCGIFHNIDSNGHNYEFSNSNPHYVNAVRNNDNYAYEILQVVKNREALYNEQWLVIMANDHGGIRQRHGEHTLEERTTWIATNYKIDEKYYANGYNGYIVK